MSASSGSGPKSATGRRRRYTTSWGWRSTRRWKDSCGGSRSGRGRDEIEGDLVRVRAANAKSNGAHAGDVGAQLCRRVRELRKRRGWTLDETSAACGVSRSMLSEIERQRANPTLAVAFRIAQAFGMSLGELVEAPAATPRVDGSRAAERACRYRSG